MNLKQIQNRIDNLQSEYQIVKRQYKEEKQNLKQSKQHLTNIKEAQEIAQNVALEIERKTHSQISGVVSLCLSEIFGIDYRFQMEFVRKRNRTQAILNLLKNGNEVGNVLESDSGGVADICGFALRLSALMLSKPRKRKLLILDEPFKFVSIEYRSRLRALLEKLSEKFNVQIIMVTHVR